VGTNGPILAAVAFGLLLVALAFAVLALATPVTPLAVQDRLGVSGRELAALAAALCLLLPAGLVIVAAAAWRAVQRSIDGG
jgi:hypothetical protein